MFSQRRCRRCSSLAECDAVSFGRFKGSPPSPPWPHHPLEHPHTKRHATYSKPSVCSIWYFRKIRCGSGFRSSEQWHCVSLSEWFRSFEGSWLRQRSPSPNNFYTDTATDRNVGKSHIRRLHRWQSSKSRDIS